jgi:hypothetical protein
MASLIARKHFLCVYHLSVAHLHYFQYKHNVPCGEILFCEDVCFKIHVSMHLPTKRILIALLYAAYIYKRLAPPVTYIEAKSDVNNLSLCLIY